MAEGALGLEITELRLGLPGAENSGGGRPKKRGFSEIAPATASAAAVDDEVNSTSERVKNRVTGWPPVCSYRQKHGPWTLEKNAAPPVSVKVSLDGAPYLRKLDLNAYRCYSDLSAALKQLFECFGIGELFSGNDQIGDDYECSEHVATYEDREGDWMLVGDVPWGMFIDACKRLRIMRGSEAMGFKMQQKSSVG